MDLGTAIILLLLSGSIAIIVLIVWLIFNHSLRLQRYSQADFMWILPLSLSTVFMSFSLVLERAKKVENLEHWAFWTQKFWWLGKGLLIIAFVVIIVRLTTKRRP